MKVQSKKLKPPFSIKTNGLEDAKQVIELLGEIGFKANQFWNREQLKEKFYDQHLDKGFVNVNSQNVIELHTHSCNDDVISRKHLLKEIPKPEYDPKYVPFKPLHESINELNNGTEKSVEFRAIKPIKVVGYKLIKPEYREAAKIIALSHLSEYFIKNYNEPFEYIGLANEAKCKMNLEKAGVLNLWFSPMYDSSITLKSGVKLSEDDIAEVKEILNNK